MHGNKLLHRHGWFTLDSHLLSINSWYINVYILLHNVCIVHAVYMKESDYVYFGMFIWSSPLNKTPQGCMVKFE